jgi:outer membrane protein W
VDDPQADGQTAQASTTEAVAPAGATDNGGYDAVAPPSTAGLVAESSAQGDGRRTIVAYSTAMSVGSTNDFIDQFSFAGFSFDWRSRLKEKFWAGVSIGWQVLYNKAERTSEIGNVALTGTQVRHLNTFPLLLTGHYYHSSEDGKIQPYGGLGAGVYASEWRVDVGLLTASSVTWHFGLAPELGVVLPMGSNRFSLSSRFNYAFESGGNPEILFFTFAFGVELD